MLVPNIYFAEFCEIVKRAFTTEFGEKDYRVFVGKTAKEYRDYYIKNRPEKTRNEQWKAWLEEAKKGLGESWPKFSNFDGVVIDSITDGTAATFHAYAVHYRMHMHADAHDLRFADRIDEGLFGAPIRATERPVFRNVIEEGKTAPFSWPPHVSKEGAFAKGANEAVWLNPHNHFSIPLSGRKREWQLLEDFIKHDPPFLIAAIIAPSGAGKTRLVSEWMRGYMAKYQDNGWDAGFVDTRDETLWCEENWTPTKNTLIVIDYTYNYAQVMSVIIDRFKDHAFPKIRLLILDHVLPDKLHADFAWQRSFRDQGNIDSQRELFFRPFPIALEPEADDSLLLRDVIACAADPYREDKRYNRDSEVVIKAADALMKIGEITDDNPTKDQIRRRDSVRHPLFAALIGQMLYRSPDEDFSGWSRRDLITHYFEREQRIPWDSRGKRNKHAKTLARWVGCYVSAATLLRGLPVRHAETRLPVAVRQKLSEKRQLTSLVDYSNRIVSGADRRTIKPFEPDILGEAFLLKFIEGFASNKKVFSTFTSMLSSFRSPRHEATTATIFLETVQRLVRNLINDDQEIQPVELSWEALLSFLDPVRFPESTLMRQAVSIAIGDVVKQSRSAGLDEYIEQFVDQVDWNDLRKASSSALWQEAAISAVHCFDWTAFKGHIDDQLKEALAHVLVSFKELSTTNSPALILAANEGCLDAMKYVMRFFDEDIDARQDEGWTGLAVGAYWGHFPIVDWLVDQGANPNIALLSNGWTGLMMASQEGRLNIVERLIDAGATVNQGTTNSGRTALMAASETGHLEVVDRLIDAGAMVDQEAMDGVTALMLASYGAYTEVVGRLIEAGATVDQRIEDNGMTALTAAIYAGHPNVVARLIEAGATIDQAVTNGMTALMIAIAEGHLDIVECLIDAGATIDQADLSGVTALMSASIAGHPDILERLINAGATVDQTAGDGTTALMLASNEGHHNAVERLIASGAKINQRDTRSGWTALMSASRHGHAAAVEHLLDAGATVDLGARNTGMTALMLASAHGYLDVVARLIDAGAIVDHQATTDNGWTALMFASYAGHLDVVARLIEAGASVDQATTEDAPTALIVASSIGHTAVVEHLIRHGADVDWTACVDGERVTALTVASAAGHSDVQETLLRFGAKKG